MPQPVEAFDPATTTWTKGAVSPVIMHHFQPVVFDDKDLRAWRPYGIRKGRASASRRLHLRSSRRSLGERTGPSRGSTPRWRRRGCAQRTNLPRGGAPAWPLERTRALAGFVQSTDWRMAQVG
jgi:hypothetical protein